MSADTDTTSTASANGTAPAATGKPAGDECEDCGPGRALGLGLLVIAAAAGLAFIGFDLASGGGLSRRLSGVPADDEETDAG